MNVPKLTSDKPSYSLLTVVFAIGVASAGAAAMYFLDPASGRGRRARIWEKGIHARNISLKRISQKSRHLRNRAQGVAHHLIAGRADRAV